MHTIGRAGRLVAAALALALVPCAATLAGPPAGIAFEPVWGQEGRDVVWIPTPPEVVTRMLELAGTTPQDFVVDLGSGDGRIVIAAAQRFDARALGVEFGPAMVELARQRAAQAGVAGRARFAQGDLFEADLSEATVITLYLLGELNRKLRPRLLALRPGTRIVSHAFDMGDWLPDLEEFIAGRRVFLWWVPADVRGHWRAELPAAAGGGQLDLRLGQTLQLLDGAAEVDGRAVPIRSLALRGTALVAVLGESGREIVLRGRIAGERVEGTASRGAASAAWSARRLSRDGPDAAASTAPAQ
jgi:SAM-dependent methyltransferase